MYKALILTATLSLTTIGLARSDREATTDRMDHAARVMQEIMAAPGNGIPEEVMEHAKCIAVVPFAGLTLDGASIRHDDDSTKTIYGRNVSNRSLLTGRVAAPASASSFLGAVGTAKAQAAGAD